MAKNTGLSRRKFILGGTAAAAMAAVAGHETAKRTSPFYRYYINDQIEHFAISRRAQRIQEYMRAHPEKFANRRGQNLAPDVVEGIKEAVFDYRAANKDKIPRYGFSSSEMFGILMMKAKRESYFMKWPEPLGGTAIVGGEPNTRGVYHHQRVSWARRLALYGAEYLEGNWAARISAPVNDPGAASFKNRADRAPGLRLRDDAYTASMTELAYTVEDVIPRFEREGLSPMTAAEWKVWLYIEHVLGFSDAVDVIKEGGSFFSLAGHFRKGTDIVSRTKADSNPSLFYDEKNKALSIRGVYQAFEERVREYAGFEDKVQEWEENNTQETAQVTRALPGYETPELSV